MRINYGDSQDGLQIHSSVDSIAMLLAIFGGPSGY